MEMSSHLKNGDSSVPRMEAVLAPGRLDLRYPGILPALLPLELARPHFQIINQRKNDVGVDQQNYRDCRGLVIVVLVQFKIDKLMRISCVERLIARYKIYAAVFSDQRRVRKCK